MKSFLVPRSRWEKTHAELIRVRAENLFLRSELADLNTDVEDLLCAAEQEGIGAAKSHHIRAQATTIRRYREALRAAGVTLPLGSDLEGETTKKAVRNADRHQLATERQGGLRAGNGALRSSLAPLADLANVRELHVPEESDR